MWWACGSCWGTTTYSWSLFHDTCYQQLHVTIYSTASRASITIILLLFWTIVLITPCMPTCSHFLSLVSPPLTIKARRYSCFVRVCFIWNQVSIDMLKPENRTSFLHATFKHFCCTFYLIFIVLHFVILCSVTVFVLLVMLFCHCFVVFVLWAVPCTGSSLLYCSFPWGKLIMNK